MSSIELLTAREILDSRGHPTIEVTCVLSGGVHAYASVPSGASTGIHEAHELRDGDMARYAGLGVLTAVNNVKQIIFPAVKGKDLSQKDLDAVLIDLDGTPNKSNLGANAILGVSMAFARAVALERGIELYEHLGSLGGVADFKIPQPMFNVINGGKHADSGLDIQEFMIAPNTGNTIREKIRAGSEIIGFLKKSLAKNGYTVSVGDEGGFAPKLSTNEEAFRYIQEAIMGAGYSIDQVHMACDVAASSFYTDGQYHVAIHGQKKLYSSAELADWYRELTETYPIISIEDGFSEDDIQGFSSHYQILGSKILIVGDDLTVTNEKRIDLAHQAQAINSVLIKLNQIGTVSETISAIQKTQSFGWKPFISHRSGETTDTFIADLAVGLSCDYIKSGSLARGERVCKYNRLMEIEDTLPSVS